jgi:hypothetical protein
MTRDSVESWIKSHILSWVTKAGCGESGASVGLAPLHLRACGVKGHSPLPWRCERLLLFMFSFLMIERKDKTKIGISTV